MELVLAHRATAEMGALARQHQRAERVAMGGRLRQMAQHIAPGPAFLEQEPMRRDGAGKGRFGQRDEGCAPVGVGAVPSIL